MKAWAAAAVLLAGAGCGPPAQRWMPLREGHRWTYEERGGLGGAVEEVRVSSRWPLPSSGGYRLITPAGEAWLGWEGDRLLASRLGDIRFDPPLPLFSGSRNEGTWSGRVDWAGRSALARGTIEMAEDEIDSSGRRFAAKKSTVRLEVEGVEHELTTWFGQGYGILRQEHRREGELVRSLRYVDGP